MESETGGIVFTGPGSEWFWIALQFVALATTFYAIYRQLQTQQAQIKDNTKVLRTQAHYNALLLAQRPFELWVGADVYFKGLVATKPGLTRFWSEFNESFDEPFRSYEDGEFAKIPTAAADAVPEADAAPA